MTSSLAASLVLSDAAQAREGELRAQLAVALRESQGVAKASRAAEAASTSLDARLARATEEAERARAQLQAERAEAAERERELRAKCETLGAQAKRAERQRGELLAAFKKQLRLIDVLKRQRIHVRRCCARDAEHWPTTAPSPLFFPTDGGGKAPVLHRGRVCACAVYSSSCGAFGRCCAVRLRTARSTSSLLK